MKRIIFSALVAVVAVGGAFASSVTITKSAKNMVIRTYYNPANSCAKLTCDTQAGTTACSSISSELPTIFSNGSCSTPQTVIGNIVPNP